MFEPTLTFLILKAQLFWRIFGWMLLVTNNFETFLSANNLFINTEQMLSLNVLKLHLLMPQILDA